jgi:hypothetical protein
MKLLELSLVHRTIMKYINQRHDGQENDQLPCPMGANLALQKDPMCNLNE